MNSRQKIILLTYSERWRSLLSQHTHSDQLGTALNLADLAAEAQRWPGSAAVIEVTSRNLAAACEFAANRTSTLHQCGLFAVCDQNNPSWAAAMNVVGFRAICGSTIALPGFFQQIARHHAAYPPPPIEIEDRWQQRLPWKPPERYAGGSFVATRFSTNQATNI